MSHSKVSIIIPLYNQPRYVGMAIDSVLAQTYTNWELIVVDDGSTDDSAEIAQSYSDPRIKCVYQPNAGLPAARNTGIRHATGEYLAFLDSDDYIGPEKLAIQVPHLAQNPDVGLSYLSRIEVDSDNNLLWLSQAPSELTLTHLLTGFPVMTNDLLMRRNWAEKIGYFDESFRMHAEDRDFYVRLFAAGCKFEQTIGYASFRRLHFGREFSHIPSRLALMKRVIDDAVKNPEMIINDDTRNQAYANIFLSWAFQALSQNQTDTGQKYLNAAVVLDQTIVSNGSKKLKDAITWFAIRDGAPHEQKMRDMVGQLTPSSYDSTAQSLGQMIGRGYIYRGFRALLWQRHQESDDMFAEAKRFDSTIDAWMQRRLIDQLYLFEKAFGQSELERVSQAFARHLELLGDKQAEQQIIGRININRAFSDYENKNYQPVPQQIVQALRHDRSYLKNRGVLSMFVRSLVKHNLQRVTL